MPELAEVETIRQYLLPVLQGAVLEHFELRRSDLGIAEEDPLQPSDAEGCVLSAVRRKGKYLDFLFGPELHLIIHLGMSGKLIYLPPETVLEEHALYQHKHTHAVWHFSSGSLLFNDVRRFGSLSLYKAAPGSLVPPLAKLGPDALSDSLTADYLFAEKKRHPKLTVKGFLLDQHIIAGLGNIYTDEILYAARIRPDSRMKRLSRKDLQKILRECRRILTEAIACGGTTFRDYRNALDHQGAYQKKLSVYGRAGVPCPSCGRALESKTIAGRHSVFCRHCQIRK